jgi:hypothetical protein
MLPYEKTILSSVSAGDAGIFGSGEVLCMASTKVTARRLGLPLNLRSIDLIGAESLTPLMTAGAGAVIV